SRNGRHQADAGQEVRRRLGAASAEEVEQCRTGERPDRDVRQQWVQLMAEPRAAEGVLEGSGGYELLDHPAERVADFVERFDLLDLGRDTVEFHGELWHAAAIPVAAFPETARWSRWLAEVLRVRQPFGRANT